MAEHARAPGQPRLGSSRTTHCKKRGKNAASYHITGKSAQTLLYDDTMAASTLHVAAAAGDKTKGKRPLVAC